MVFQHKAKIVIPLLLLAAVPGCFKKKAPALPLKPYAQEQENVHILVKPLGKKESKELFGASVTKCQALELVVENNNDCYFILHPWYIGLPLTSPKKVSQALHINTPLIVSSMLVLGMLGVEWVAPLSIFFYAALPVGLWSSAQNKAISKNVMRDAIYKNVESIIIPPYGQIRRHFFVSYHDFTPNFTITLLSGKDNKPVRFPVSLAQKKVV